MLSNLGSWRVLIGLMVSVGFLGLFFYRVDLNEVLQAIWRVNPMLVATAVGLYFFAVMLRSLRWQYLLRPLGYLPLNLLFQITVVGYAANNLLPLRLGELVRAYSLSEKAQISTSATMGTIFVERIFDGFALLFLAAVALPLLLATGSLTGLEQGSSVLWLSLAGVTIGAFVAVSALLTVLALFPRLTGSLISLASLLLPQRLRPKFTTILGDFLSGISSLGRPSRYLTLFLMSVLVWSIEGAVYLLIALAFPLPEIFGSSWLIVPTILLVTAGANLVLSLPSSQGGVGPFEFMAATILELVGAAAGTARAFALVVHITILAPITLLGLIYLWRDNLSLIKLTRPEEPVPGIVS